MAATWDAYFAGPVPPESGVNWDAYTHEELHQMLWQDADVADVSMVARDWAEHRAALDTHAEVLREQRAALLESWEGAAAEEAANRLGVLADRMEKISELAGAGQRAAQDAADALAMARAMMPPPPGAAAPFGGPELPAFGGAAPAGSGMPLSGGVAPASGGSGVMAGSGLPAFGGAAPAGSGVPLFGGVAPVSGGSGVAAGSGLPAFGGAAPVSAGSEMPLFGGVAPASGVAAGPGLPAFGGAAPAGSEMPLFGEAAPEVSTAAFGGEFGQVPTQDLAAAPELPAFGGGAPTSPASAPAPEIPGAPSGGGSSFYFGDVMADQQKAQAVRAMQTYESSLVGGSQLIGEARGAIPAAAAQTVAAGAAQGMATVSAAVPWERLVGGGGSATSMGIGGGSVMAGPGGSVGASPGMQPGPGGRVGAMPGAGAPPFMPAAKLAADSVMARGAGHGGVVPPVGGQRPAGADSEEHENRMPVMDHGLFGPDKPPTTAVIGLSAGGQQQ